MTAPHRESQPDSKTDLLPCPFCGPGHTVNIVMQHNPQGGWLYEIVCQGCSVTMPCDDSEADAIADWNTRTPSPAGAREALAGILRQYRSAPTEPSMEGAVIDAIFALRFQHERSGVQTGHVLMPREPTREMWAAGGTAACEKRGYHHDIVVEAVYRAMVEAASAVRP